MAILDSVGERLARGVNRRHFLRRCAETGFIAATGWATLGSGTAGATGACPDPRGACQCFPPGPYCNTVTECKGWRCKPPCDYLKTFYPDACWCTKECPNGDRSSRGWYKCCDCTCPSGSCGCRKFVQTCSGPAGSC